MSDNKLVLDINEEEKTPREKQRNKFCRCCSSDEFRIIQDNICERCLREFS